MSRRTYRQTAGSTGSLFSCAVSGFVLSPDCNPSGPAEPIPGIRLQALSAPRHPPSSSVPATASPGRDTLETASSKPSAQSAVVRTRSVLCHHRRRRDRHHHSQDSSPRGSKVSGGDDGHGDRRAQEVENSRAAQSLQAKVRRYGCFDSLFVLHVVPSRILGDQ